jgi:hypothetical protein
VGSSKYRTDNWNCFESCFIVYCMPPPQTWCIQRPTLPNVATLPSMVWSIEARKTRKRSYSAQLPSKDATSNPFVNHTMNPSTFCNRNLLHACPGSYQILQHLLAALRLCSYEVATRYYYYNERIHNSIESTRCMFNPAIRRKNLRPCRRTQ